MPSAKTKTETAAISSRNSRKRKGASTTGYPGVEWLAGSVPLTTCHR